MCSGVEEDVVLKSEAITTTLTVQRDIAIVDTIFHLVYFSNSHRQTKMLTHLVQRKPARVRVFVYEWHWLLFHLHCSVFTLIVFLSFHMCILFLRLSRRHLAPGLWQSVMELWPRSKPLGWVSALVVLPVALSELWRCWCSQLLLTPGYWCLTQSALSTTIRDTLLDRVYTHTFACS